MPKNLSRRRNDVNVTNTTLSTTATVAATQSGTWTVQPGNTANTTAWKVDGSAVTQPVSVAQTLVVDPRRGQTLLFAKIDTATSGDQTVISADASKKIKVVSYIIVNTLAQSLTWKSASTALSGAMAAATLGVIAIAGAPSAWIMQTAVNEALVLNLSASTQVSGHITYFLEA